MGPPAEDGSERPPPTVTRDESEVSSWPRGLVSYVVSGRPDEGPPPEEEDRVAQRIRLASRLIDLLHALGVDDPEWIRELAAAEKAYRAQDRGEAARRVNELIGRLGVAAERARPREDAPG